MTVRGGGSDSTELEPKVLIVYLGSPTTGGTVRAVVHLAEALSRLSRVTVATYRNDGLFAASALSVHPLGEAPAANTLESSPAIGIFHAPTLLRLLFKIRRAARRNPNALILPFLTGSALVTLAATIGLPNRVIVCERNDVSAQPFGWHVRLLRLILYPRAAAITVNSQSPAALTLLQHVSRGRPVFSVPNFPPRGMLRSNPESSDLILLVGRLSSQKGHSIFLEAFAKVRSRLPSWNVTILGDGPLRSELEGFARDYKLEDVVTFTGHVDDPRPFYASAGLFVLPSLYEGTSNALQEALKAGLPCIASKGALPLGAEDFILSFPTGSVDHLADCLTHACTSDDLRRSNGEAALRWAEGLTEDASLMAWKQALSLRL